MTTREVIVCFGPNTKRERGMRFNTLAATGELIGGIRTVESLPTFRRMLTYLGATPEQLDDLDDQMRRWGQGSVHVRLEAGRKNLLGLR